MKRILLTGANGQVGWELRRTLLPLGEVIALDRAAMDLTKPDAIRRAVADVKPAIIVNAAAHTAVDKAESEPDLAMAINGIAPGILAEEAKRLNALLVHYSTDYVFDGTASHPYTETDLPNPLSVYGKTKLAGEVAIRGAWARHLILRVSWVYGARGKNFMLTIRRLAAEREELRVVNDQVGAPTWSGAIAEATAQALAHGDRLAESAVSGADVWSDLAGTYHLSAAGAASWFRFAEAILTIAPPAGKERPRLVPIPTSEYPTPAARPGNSLLSNAKIHRVFGIVMADWKTQVQRCLATEASALGQRG